MDFYTILGVPRDADINVIKQRYRKLVKECHPDTHPGDKKAEERFKRISQAYTALADKDKRKEYDRELDGAKTADMNRKKKKSAGTNPLDTSAIFEKYMGFK